ncbi:MAG: DegT/DnrJ/EryC1/StrS family aminotransferase [Thermodesulfobacteriota bacterium]
MNKVTPLSEPEISKNEWKYKKDCLDAGWVLLMGQYVTRFEGMVAQYVGSRYAVAWSIVSSSWVITK